jgi:hypothetical protein
VNIEIGKFSLSLSVEGASRMKSWMEKEGKVKELCGFSDQKVKIL